MPSKISPPAGADLTQTCQEIASLYGVSMAAAYRWKKEAGIPMKRGYRGIRKSSLARLVTPEEWAQGCGHVASMLGVSRQAAWVMRNKLIEAGHGIPTLKRGRRRNDSIN